MNASVGADAGVVGRTSGVRSHASEPGDAMSGVVRGSMTCVTGASLLHSNQTVYVVSPSVSLVMHALSATRLWA